MTEPSGINLEGRLARRCDFLIQRDDLSKAGWSSSPSPALLPGDVRLRIDAFALTANNITYAAFGEKMGYWDFFPAPPGFGRLPVWGYAEVVESRHSNLKIGERVFGCLPVSSELVVQVSEVTPIGFSDASPWRADANILYREYRRLGNDPSSKLEPFEAVMGPLFRTAFLLD